MEEKVVASDSTESASSKKRREDKIRKRDPRAWENIYKSISTLSETEKIEAISKKYSELYDEFRKVSQNCQNLERNCTALQKEKEHMRAEQAKSIIARSRLENLCRELQKQNKQIKEENMVKIKEEEERRKEVAAKFQKTLDEVTSMMNENREKNFKLRDDNIDMSKKIAELYAEFQKREEDIKRMAKQMDLEKQLSKATITKLEFELKAEKELWAKERNILQNNLEQSENRNKHLLENIKGMEEHLSVYKGQYEDFESTLDKSNKFFDNCKAEMVKMSKHIVLLEKEVNNWKSKWQASASSLIELSTTKQAQDLHLVAADKKIDQLQKLCRQLQVDRASFLKLLKANGIEPVTQPCVETPEKPPTPKERELSVLKDKLKILQTQLKSSIAAEANEANSMKIDSEVPVSIDNLPNLDENDLINVVNGESGAPEESLSPKNEEVIVGDTELKIEAEGIDDSPKEVEINTDVVEESTDGCNITDETDTVPEASEVQKVTQSDTRDSSLNSIEGTSEPTPQVLEISDEIPMNNINNEVSEEKVGNGGDCNIVPTENHVSLEGQDTGSCTNETGLSESPPKIE